MLLARATRRRTLPHEVSLGEPPRRMAFLALLGAGLGVVGGLAAFVVVRLVALLSNLALLHRVAFSLPDLAHYRPGAVLVPVALGGAVAVVALARWTPVIRGHGIPESLEAVVQRDSCIRPRVLVAKPLSAAVAMGTGGPFGAEGPIIVTGGCVGSLLGQWLRVSSAERRILLATGAAAGMAGVFATPVAAVVLAFELLVFERSLRALLPLLFATAIATELHAVLLGSQPLFAVTRPLAVPPVLLPLFLPLGVAVGLLAIVVNRGLFAVEAGFRRLPVPDALHPLLGALGFALVGLAVPGSLSVGYWAISDAVNDRFLVGTAAVLCVAKLVSWWVSLASNTSGGTLAPIFLVGATMGETIGIGFAHLFPSAHVEPAAFAVVAMGASFGVSARALLTGGVFALEVTGASHLVVPMLLVLGVAEVVAERALPDRLMTEKLVRRGYRIDFDTEADPFRTAVAGQLMEPLPVDADAPCGPSVERLAYARDALVVLLADGADAVTVTDGGKPVGVLRREALRGLLARRIAESELQEPRLGRPLPVGRPEQDGAASTGRGGCAPP
ncbi:MAG: chloride channel protein [Actinomycetota bacterium]|nr:chloride channel protein [Actinomycetota bacterium]